MFGSVTAVVSMRLSDGREVQGYLNVLRTPTTARPKLKYGGITDNTSLRAMTDVQLHRYNAATVTMVQAAVKSWVERVSTPENPVTTYFIQIGLDEVTQPQLKLLLNKIPTSFSLTNEQVEAVIESARSLLRNDPDFQRFLADVAKP